MRNRRRRGVATALVGTVAAGIMIVSAATASAAVWDDTGEFYFNYQDCWNQGTSDVNAGIALAFQCQTVSVNDGSMYITELYEFVD